MPVPVPTIVCGRCGTPFVDATVCGSCGHPITSDQPLDAGAWRARLRPAEQQRVIGALILDAGCLLLPVAALVVVTLTNGWHAWAAALTGVVLLALLTACGLWCLRGWGRFVGGALFKLRTLDSLTGLAPERLTTPRTLLVAEARGATDPLVITAPPLTAQTDGGAPTGDSTADSPSTPGEQPEATPDPRPRGCFVAAGESLTPLVGPLLVGRYPVRQIATEPLPALELPDFSRTMSRAHVLLENENGRLWATDLGSGNGTRLHRPGEPTMTMAPRTRMPIVLGTRLDCGEQSLLITDGRRAA